MASDKHICLVCNETIRGLDNYIKHKQSVCEGTRLGEEESLTTTISRFGSFDTNSGCCLQNGVRHSSECLDVIKSEPTISMSLSSPTEEEGQHEVAESSSAPSIDFDLLFDSEIQEELDKLDFKSFFTSLQLRNKTEPEKTTASNQPSFSKCESFLTEDITRCLYVTEPWSDLLSKPSEKQKEVLEALEQCRTTDFSSMFTDFDFDSDSENVVSSDVILDLNNVPCVGNNVNNNSSFLSCQGGKSLTVSFEKNPSKFFTDCQLKINSKPPAGDISVPPSAPGRKIVTRLSTGIRKPSTRYINDDDDVSSSSLKKCHFQSSHSTSDKSNVSTNQSDGNSSVLSGVNNSYQTGQQATILNTATSSNRDGKSGITQNPNLNPAAPTCAICNKTFCSKYSLACHLNSPFHLKRVKKCQSEESEKGKSADDNSKHGETRDMEVLLFRLKPYQCRPCNFWSEDESEFCQHVAKNEEHSEKIKTLVGPLMCVRCQFISHSNEDIVKHISSAEHTKAAERFTTVGKPVCILKENRYRVRCVVCANCFHSASQLLAHLKTACWLRVQKAKVSGSVVSSAKSMEDVLSTSENFTIIDISESIQMPVIEKRKRGRPPKTQPKDSQTIEANKSTNGENTAGVKLNLLLPSETHEIDSSEDVEDYDNDDDSDEEFNLEREKFRRRAQKRRTKQKKASRDFPPDASLGRVKSEMLEELCVKQEFHGDDEETSEEGKGNGNERYWCSVCGLGFFYAEKLAIHQKARTHIRKVEEMKTGNGQSFKCQRCGRLFYALNALQFHEINHQLSDSKISGKDDQDATKSERSDFTDLSAEADAKCLLLYKQLKTNAGQKGKVICPECGKLLTRVGMLSHLRQHTGSLPFKCTFCLKRYSDVAVMRRHLKAHLGIMYYKCPICSKQFNRKLTMQTHALKEHGTEEVERHGVTPPSHQCSKCGRQFMQLCQLTAHMKLHDKQLHCPYPDCTSVFRYQSELAVHLRTHSNERHFLCDECGYSGKSRHQLKRHQRQHLGDKRYQCSSCEYKTTLAANLRRHERVHTGSKPYKCLYCDYSCNTQENLRKHILKTRRHAGKLVYPCQLCKFATNSAQDFQRHLETEHQHDRQTLPSVLVGMYRPDEGKKIGEEKSTAVTPAAGQEVTSDQVMEFFSEEKQQNSVTPAGQFLNMDTSQTNLQLGNTVLPQKEISTDHKPGNQEQYSQQLTKQLLLASFASSTTLSNASAQQLGNQSNHLSFLSQSHQTILNQLALQSAPQAATTFLRQQLFDPGLQSSTLGGNGSRFQLHMPQDVAILSNNSQIAATQQSLSLILPQLSTDLTNVTYALQLINGNQNLISSLSDPNLIGLGTGATHDQQLPPIYHMSGEKPTVNNIAELKPLVIDDNNLNRAYSLESIGAMSSPCFNAGMSEAVAALLMTPIDGRDSTSDISQH